MTVISCQRRFDKGFSETGGTVKVYTIIDWLFLWLFEPLLQRERQDDDSLLKKWKLAH